MNGKPDTYDDLLGASSKALYEQSTKVSTICRGMVYAIIGTIWIVSYSDGMFYKPTCWLLWTLGLCGLYLVLDMTHYFVDSCFHYNREQKIFAQNKLLQEASKSEKQKYAKNAKRSFGFLVTKFCLTLLIVIIFVIGLTQLYMSAVE